MFDLLKEKLHREKHRKNTERGPSEPQGVLSTVSAPALPEKEPSEVVLTKQVALGPPQKTIAPPIEQSTRHAPTEAPNQTESPPKDLWLDAFNKLPPSKQDTLRRMGFNTLSTACGQMESTINDLVGVVNQKQEECKKKFWHVSIGGEDIVLRNYTTRILGWLEKAGDIAVQFAPPQASIPWDLIKNVMQIPVNESEQMGALLATTEKIVRITSRGQVYEQIYLPQTCDVPLDSVQRGLESSLLQIYSQSLDLLAESLTLFSSGTAKRTLEAIVNPEKYTGTRIGMLEWISPIPFGKHHADIKERRTPNTGEWLVQHEDFSTWEDKKSSALFWLQGPPGTGKTYLTSTVIDRIQGRLSDSQKDEGLAFFYCNRDEEDRSTPLSILQSIVRQLSTTASNPESVQIRLLEAYKNARNRGSNFRSDECKKQILASFETYQQTTLVIDAMDECDPDSRYELIETLSSFVSDTRQPVKIFISSRPDPDIRSLLEDTSNIGISANDNQDDILKFLTLELEKLSKKAAFIKRIKADIIDRLLQRCQGMFQWASLQVHQIVKCRSESSVWKRLDNLPEDLQKAYDEIWNDIESLEEPDHSVVKRALCWVMAAPKPMSSEMLLSAIRVDSDGNIMTLGDKLDEEGLLSLCNNFLIVDAQLEVWRFPHLSVREYLEKKPDWSLSDAQSHAASTCLSYMMKAYQTKDLDINSESEKKETPINSSETGESDNGFGKSHPFHLYLRHTWYQHLRLVKETEEAKLKPLLKLFLGSPHSSSMQYRNWHQLAFQDTRSWGTLWNNEFHAVRYFGMDSPRDIMDEISPSNSAILAVCRFSFPDVFADWYEEGAIDITCQNKRGANLLFLSALAGSTSICKLLVQGEIDVNFILDTNYEMGQTQHKSALSAAAIHGNLEIVKYLVEAGANVNAVLPHSGHEISNSAFESAIMSENLELVKYLIQEVKADICLSKFRDGEVLYGIDQTIAAVSSIHNVEMLKFVLETTGADVNMRIRPILLSHLSSALAIKLFISDVEGVEFLLRETEADVHLPLHGSEYGSAFEYSAAERSPTGFNFAELLIEKGGAKVNTRSTEGNYGSALAAACEWDLSMVEYLVEAGADVNLSLVVGDHGSALARASVYNIEIVEFLVKKAGASVNASFAVGYYGSALAAASAYSAGTVKFLVEEAGADVNMPLEHPDFGCALTRAALNEDPMAMDALIQAGADINVQHPAKTYGTPLIVASLFGDRDCVERLIQAGADVNLKLENVSRFATALEAAQAEWSEQDTDLFENLVYPRTRGLSEFDIEQRKDQKPEIVKLLRENGATA
ncbi:hypothetical protein N7466_000876 [Penicillium verhagenii]|uniref:uncharacterized protein n=1 Tax=Penicillium verhagenii TaxID=1562060 RepID=UPI002545AEC1|nr:uncharacterized protein N7466_000876 [Penicillium verhagenii]KAJ5947861.1 hypothetical protein N7466_000876 [Penicillium verhagenii]